MSDERNRFGGEIEHVATTNGWMDDPHKKMLEPCPDCGEKVRIEHGEPRIRGTGKEISRKWFKCSGCGKTLGYADVLVGNTSDGRQPTIYEGMESM